MSEADERRKLRHRSPAYPSVPLGVAIEKAGMIYKEEKRAAAPVSVVVQHCGMDVRTATDFGWSRR